jgi:hypothetical protein
MWERVAGEWSLKLEDRSYQIVVQMRRDDGQKELNFRWLFRYFFGV